MRAMDCRHDAHDDVHFTASDDDELFAQVKAHTQQYHPEITDEQIQAMIGDSAYAQ